LLSAPLLVNGFAKLQKILGNDQISQINSWLPKTPEEGVSNSGGCSPSHFEEIFDMKEFEVNLEPLIMYERKE
jgi:hypothetical protein